MNKVFNLAILLSFSISLLSLAVSAKKEAPVDLSALSPTEATSKLLESNDLDKDGKLSPKEVNFSFRKRRFKKVDANADGFLDQSELENSFTKASEAMAQRNQDQPQKASN
jgi:Ca2+-binding EF-hand superfamily protein